ncbi:uncharacterized protein A4U43_C03F11750 [Asparagus officinalis]|uniref:RING-type domain-containing protein n=1 Tax=Asparagus officinalis TaxID=4686 RepID=A0A5P1F990_ASPOF|nr:uncharacterized protein A4U43_C03F11750 [Asparagus officinalis]
MRVHLLYHCGPNARKTEKQAKQQKKRKDDFEKGKLKKGNNKQEKKKKKNVDDNGDKPWNGPKRVSLLHSVKWERIILDEAHFIKDRNSNTARAVFALDSVYKWALSGTPLQNRVGELYSLVRFLQVYPYANYFCKSCDCNIFDHDASGSRSCLNCPHSITRHFCWWNRYINKPIQCGVLDDRKRAMILLKGKVLKSIVLRRTKKGRAADLALPPRITCLRRDYLDKSEKEIYEAIYTQSRVQFDAYVGAGTLMNNYAHIFDLLTRLRQALDHPYLVVYSKTAGLVKEGEESTATGDCGICHDPPEDVVATSCDHVFCKACLIDYSASLGNVSCPSCSKPLTVDLTANNSGQKNSAMAIKGFKRSGIMSRIKIADFKTSTKIDALREEIRNMVENDSSAKGIVFSQFTSFLDLISFSLQMSGVKCVQLVGSMSLAEREKVIKSFTEDGDCRIFLMSLKAGGVALNLTAASYGQCLTFNKQIDYFTTVYTELVQELGSAQAQDHLSKSIFSFIIGSNDILSYIRSSDGMTPQQLVDSMITTLRGQLKTIYNLGARKFAFVGTGPIGCCPSLRRKNGSDSCNSLANSISLLYAQGSASLLKDMQSELSGFNYSFFNSTITLLQYLQDPSNYGFTEVKAACCGLGNLNAKVACLPVSKLCQKRSDFVFWDLFHPTEKTAGLLADTIFDGSSPFVYPINVKQLTERLGLPSPPPYLSIPANSNITQVFLKGVNFASGGAGVLDSTRADQCLKLTKQIDYYSTMYTDLVEKLGFIQARDHISMSIFAFIIGSNDILDYVKSSSSYQLNVTAEQLVGSMISSLEVHLKRIYNLGARKIIFVGTGPIGCCPQQRENSTSGECSARTNSISAQYDSGVASLLHEMKSEFNDMNYSFFNSSSTLMEYIESPDAHGFTDVKAACCGIGNLNALIACLPVSRLCEDRTSYVFWDLYHPTEATARLLTETMFSGSRPYVFPINVKQLGDL